MCLSASSSILTSVSLRQVHGRCPGCVLVLALLMRDLKLLGSRVSIWLLTNPSDECQISSSISCGDLGYWFRWVDGFAQTLGVGGPCLWFPQVQICQPFLLISGTRLAWVSLNTARMSLSWLSLSPSVAVVLVRESRPIYLDNGGIVRPGRDAKEIILSDMGIQKLTAPTTSLGNRNLVRPPHYTRIIGLSRLLSPSSLTIWPLLLPQCPTCLELASYFWEKYFKNLLLVLEISFILW